MNQAEFLPPNANQLTTEVNNVPISDDHIQASAAADNLVDSPYDIKMAESDAEAEGEGDSGEAKQSPTHTRDSDDEYFEVEAIRRCKLGSKVHCCSTFFILILTILLGGGRLTSQVEGL